MEEQAKYDVDDKVRYYSNLTRKSGKITEIRLTRDEDEIEILYRIDGQWIEEADIICKTLRHE